MEDTLKTSETANQGQSQTTVSNTAPVVDNSIADQAAKELEQLRMRNNQLANQLEEARKADEARKAKELETKEEFKTLYEQTQSKLQEFESTQRANEQREALSKATEELLKGYDTNVVDLAKTANLSLTEDTEEAKNILKAKLDAFKAKITPQSRVTGNNPSNPAPLTTERSSLTAKGTDGSSPMAIAGAKGDDSVVLDYIHSLPAIQRMREIANNGA